MVAKILLKIYFLSCKKEHTGLPPAIYNLKKIIIIYYLKDHMYKNIERKSDKTLQNLTKKKREKQH